MDCLIVPTRFIGTRDAILKRNFSATAGRGGAPEKTVGGALCPDESASDFVSGRKALPPSTNFP
jgi:hypothetical protein